MSSASLTSTDAVKHSNYHDSDRGAAIGRDIQCSINQTTHFNKKKADTHFNINKFLKLMHGKRLRKNQLK